MINISKRILILCEDKKSSKFYFESFKKDEKLKRDLASIVIDVCHPKNHDPIGLVNEAKYRKLKAKRERNPYNEIWVVLDRNSHANIDQALKTADDNNIFVALSVVCFEYWILLHFERTTRPFTKCDEIISYIKHNYLPEYDKKINYYVQLKDRLSTAIENAKWLEKQVEVDIQNGIKKQNLSSYTEVHLLVSKIIKPENII